MKSETRDDRAVVESLVAAYVKTIDTLDLQSAEQLWLTEGVTFIHPRGHERGWTQIKEKFYLGTMDVFFSERRLSVRDLQVVCYERAAYVEFYWDFKATLRADGGILNTAGRETQLYIFARDGWRLAHVHYSGMPVTGDREGF